MHAFKLCFGGLLSLQPPASSPPPVSLSSCVSFAHCARLPVTTAMEYIFHAGSREAVERWQRARCVRARSLQLQMECVDTCASMWTTREQTLTTCWTMTRHSAPGCSMSIGNVVLQVSTTYGRVGGWRLLGSLKDLLGICLLGIPYRSTPSGRVGGVRGLLEGSWHRPFPTDLSLRSP